MTYPQFPQPPAANPAPVRPAAIAPVGVVLIVLAAINALTAAVLALTLPGRIAHVLAKDTPAAERAGGVSFELFLLGVCIATMVVAVLTIVGASRMLSRPGAGTLPGRMAVLAVIPVTSCCFLAGIPVGLWARSVLRRPECRQWLVGAAPRGMP